MPIPKITLTVRVTAETHALLSDAARASKQSMNEIAEGALERASKKIIAAHERKSFAENINELKEDVLPVECDGK